MAWIKPTLITLALILVITSYWHTYDKGVSSGIALCQSNYEAREAEQRQQQDKAAAELVEQNNRVATQHHSEQQSKKQKTRILTKEVVKYVVKTVPGDCALPDDGVRLLNCIAEIQNGNPNADECGTGTADTLPAHPQAAPEKSARSSNQKHLSIVSRTVCRADAAIRCVPRQAASVESNHQKLGAG